jgi:uncharacterized membrane protein YqjE
MSTLYVDSSDKTSISYLLREFFQKLNDLFKTQVELIRLEVGMESRRLAATLACGVFALVFGVLAVIFLGVSATLLLAPYMGIGLSALITTFAYLALAGIAALMAKREFGKAETLQD